MFGQYVEAVKCAETGDALTDREVIYAATVEHEPIVVVLSREPLMQIPGELREYDGACRNVQEGLNIHVTVDIGDGVTVQVDDWKFSLPPSVIIEYLPETAKAFGLVPATST